MIALFIMLLGASAVSTDNWKMCAAVNAKNHKGWVYKDPSPVEARNFENTVTFVRDTSVDVGKELGTLFVVSDSGKAVPNVAVNGQIYQLLALNLIHLKPDDSMAALILTFDNDVRSEYVTFIVPLLSIVESALFPYEVLDHDLLGLADMSDGISKAVSIKWLQPLLNNIFERSRPPEKPGAMFVTDCEYISSENLHSLFSSIEESTAKKAYRKVKSFLARILHKVSLF